MNRMLLGSLGLLGVVLAAGCGSKDEEKPVTLASYAEAVCEAMARCQPDSLATVGGADRCPERYRIYLETTQALPGTAYADPGWLSRCVPAIGSMTCEQMASNQLGPCSMSAGTLGDGAACSQSMQCASLACVKADYTSDCGVCTARAGLDEPCGNGVFCAAGLYCGYSSVSSDQRCMQAETPDAGDPYTPDEPKIGDDCSSYQTCGSELRCHSGVCALPVPLGGACSTPTDCVSGAFCDPAKYVCAAVKRVGEGQACDVAGVECAEGLWCKAGAVCVAYIADGAACDGYAGYSADGCLFPAICNGGICTLPTAPVCE